MRSPLPEVHLQAMAYSAGHWIPNRGSAEILDLDAPYQRPSVWTDAQRVALIKSLTMGVPIGSIIVAKQPITGDPNAAFLRVVDGKQRIETIRAWAAGEFEVPVSWFREEHCGPGSYRNDLVAFDLMTVLYQRHFAMHVPVPALEFDPQRVWLGRNGDGQPEWYERNTEEILQAEAELYMLINASGTDQTVDDLLRAEALARPALTSERS